MRKWMTMFLLVALTVGAAERKVELKGTPVRCEQLEIVLPETTPLLDFAAAELKTNLSKVTGKEIPIVKTPESGQGRISLILGDNALARSAGLDVSKLPPEGFYIRRAGNRIFLLGADSATDRPGANRWKQWYKRGTLSAVYDFLERFADARFFFPGKMGTVVTAGRGVMLPERIDILDRPDYSFRSTYSGASRWYEKEDYPDNVNGQNYSHLIYRMSDSNVPFGHGLAYLDYIGRFGKSHPEYFAMMPDGRRYNRPELTHTGHLCFSGGIKEEIYQDVKAFLTGKPASSRGLKYWNANVGNGKYFSVMPQDWLYWCGCPVCSKIAPAGREYDKYGDAVGEALWQFTADVANRLKKEGVDGVVTQMPYGPLAKVPKCDLPDNISVQLAVKGLGARRYWKEDRDLIRRWAKKVKGPISIWTYPGKHMSKAELKGVPAAMHHQMGEYFQYMRPDLYGVFLESETDFEIFNYLNYYIFSKVCWNLDSDVKKLLDDHYRKMYGSGASAMETFFDDVEKLWCTRVIGNIIDTALGPVSKLPNDFEVWTKIYSPEKLREWNALFDRAEKNAAGEPEALERIKFIRREFLGPILDAGRNFKNRQALLGNWSFAVPGSVWLRPFKGEVNDVATRVDVRREPGVFIFEFDCKEPEMAKLKAVQQDADAPLTFADSCVELLLNPSGDRKNYFHFIVNANGALYDTRCQINEKPELSWNSGAKAKAEKLADGYKVTLAVPEKALGKFDPKGFPVNFARHRALENSKLKEIYYQWSPVAGQSFHSVERYGIMKLVKEPSANLIKDADFDVTFRNAWQAGAWLLWKSAGEKGGQKIEFDPSVFVEGGKSLHLVNVGTERMNASQNFTGMKPNQKYRLTYFIRTEDIQGPVGAGAYFSNKYQQLAFPTTRLTGTLPWHQLSFEFTTKPEITPETKCNLGLWIWNGAGQAWFDKVELIPVEK